MCLLFGRVRAGREIEMWVILSHRASMWAAYFLLTLWSPFVGLSTQNSEKKRSCPSSSFVGTDQLGAPYLVGGHITLLTPSLWQRLYRQRAMPDRRRRFRAYILKAGFSGLAWVLHLSSFCYWLLLPT